MTAPLTDAELSAHEELVRDLRWLQAVEVRETRSEPGKITLDANDLGRRAADLIEQQAKEIAELKAKLAELEECAGLPTAQQHAQLAALRPVAEALAQCAEALSELMRVEPYVYEGRLEASLTVPVETWEKLVAALAKARAGA